MHKIENELKSAKRMVIIEFCILAIIIICGAVIYGAQHSQWLNAAKFAALLLVLTSIFMPLVYCRAKQRMEKLDHLSEHIKKGECRDAALAEAGPGDQDNGSFTKVCIVPQP